MRLPRPLFHLARLADAVLFWPALTFVVWGELVAPEGRGLLNFLARINDKALHFIAYFILAAMAGAAFRDRRPVFTAVLALIVLGGALETLQGFVGRDSSAYDALANTVGAVTGGLLARTVVEPLRRRIPSW
jgi:VanZ family protein